MPNLPTQSTPTPPTPSATTQVTLTPVYAYLNARIMPVLRGELFEDHLGDALAQRGIGEIVGGGTLQAKEGEIIHCGIDLDLALTPDNLASVCDFLTRCGAPKGSKLQFQRDGVDQELPFGQAEGIAIYLNGTDLPKEVYKTSDINVVIESIEKLTAGVGRFLGYWEGPTETALYFYGNAAADLQSRIAPFLAEYPLCQKARLVQIA